MAACVAFGATPASANASIGFHDHLVPERHDSPLTRATAWTPSGGWLVAPTEWNAAGGSRVAALIEVADQGGPITIEARGVGVADAGPWLAMNETFRGEGHRVAVVDLGDSWVGAEIRVSTADDSRVGDVSWELLEPRYPDAGRISREAASEETGVLLALDSTLTTLGVVSRQAWGARPTGCSATEDNWYRMAIHHTAGGQTSGGTVEGALKAVQAYTMDSGGFCDIPYQFLVGHDGSLWEGRSLALRSGATGGGNNDGNIAVSFLGCYHPSGCPGGVSHAVTEEMMTAAQVLVQTLVRQHEIVSDTETIRGHRDWPGNSTACPGEFVHGRLAELRADIAWYTGAEAGRSFPANADAPLQVAVGTSTQMWIELTNTGGLTWEPNETFLAPVEPRDTESPLHDPSWVSPIRIATVAAPVAPGEVGRFTFSITAADAGEYEQRLGLVHEGVTWFADAPWGGGPAEDALVLRVAATNGGPGDPADPPGDDPDSDNPGIVGGCASGSGTGSSSVALLCIAFVLAARRRRPV